MGMDIGLRQTGVSEGEAADTQRETRGLVGLSWWGGREKDIHKGVRRNGQHGGEYSRTLTSPPTY